MKSGIAAVLAFAVMVLATGIADAKRHARRGCQPEPPHSIFYNLFGIGIPEPQGNGCSPTVHQYGRYIGQDPDANIRFQLMRDPATGNPEFY